MTARTRRAAAGWASILLMTAALVALVRLGHGSLAAPPVLHPGHLRHWVEQRDAPTMAFAVLRSLAVLAAAYLLASTALGIVAHAGHATRLIAISDVATLPAVRRVVAAVVGAGLTASLGATSVLPAAGAGRAAVVATAARPPAGTGTIGLRRVPLEPPTVLRRRPDDTDSATMTVIPATDERPSAPVTWTVAAGESFWHEAEQVLAGAWGRPPSTAETASYWATLVAHNDGRLAVPGNADLVFVGQVFELPPVPNRPD